jgi:sulfotransferase family protein
MQPSAIAPFPVIVGVPRSGTTVLRLMLDSHPDLAIPPETGFIPGCAGLSGSGAQLRDDFVRWITTFPVDAPAWADFAIPVETLRRELASQAEFKISDGLRAFYRLYAGRFGKPRWGDKTPLYALEMAAIARLLPESHFIHVIRDGRDVALSWRQTWFSPGDDIPTLARAWADWVTRAQAQSLQVAHYIEIRFEKLVSEPEAVLREVADFVGLSYTSDMLDYHIHSQARLEEHGPRFSRDGRELVSRERRREQQKNTMRPLDATRAGAWRSAMNPVQRREFASEAGSVLRALGYDS